MSDFEYDSKKSQTNLQNHGIGFDSVQELLLDVDLIEVSVKISDKPRSFVIGKIGAKHWSAIITSRNAFIRIISVRRSRKSEVELYES
tara:strand:+ start:50 stop:313 length:264 start_codon:yes stop_codon:yes gene_type:complete